MLKGGLRAAFFMEIFPGGGYNKNKRMLMRRWLLLGIAVFSFGSCEMAFRNSLFDGIDPVVPLDSTKLGSMTLEQVKNSLGPSFYKSLRADANALSALSTNLESQYGSLGDKASRRQAARLYIMVLINSTLVLDVLYKAPTTVTPLLTELTLNAANIQTGFHTMLGGITAPQAKILEFYNVMAKILTYLENLSNQMTNPGGTNASDLVEFYGDENPGDMAQAGLLAAFFSLFHLTYTGAVGNEASTFYSFYSSSPVAMPGTYDGGTQATNFSLINDSIKNSAAINLAGLKFFNPIRKKLPF